MPLQSAGVWHASPPLADAGGGAEAAGAEVVVVDADAGAGPSFEPHAQMTRPSNKRMGWAPFMVASNSTTAQLQTSSVSASLTRQPCGHAVGRPEPVVTSAPPAHR